MKAYSLIGKKKNLKCVRQANVDVSKNALLSDICLGTSAAPTFLPAHYIETKDANGKMRSYDLIDGGVAANNPVSDSFL